MAYTPSENRLGLKSFTTVDTTTSVPFGTIVRGQDLASGQGAGEFIYLPGVAGNAVGNMVIYNLNGRTVTRTVGATHKNLGAPVAVAMAAITASQYGWYQIAGLTTIKKSALHVPAASKIWLAATTGRVQGSAASGRQLLGAYSNNTATVTSTTSTVLVMLSRPHIQGQTI